MVNCAQCKYGEKWDNDEYHCLKEIGTQNSSLHPGNWFCADFKETNSCDADDSKTDREVERFLKAISRWELLHRYTDNV